MAVLDGSEQAKGHDAAATEQTALLPGGEGVVRPLSQQCWRTGDEADIVIDMSDETFIARITSQDLATDNEIERAAEEAGADPKRVKHALGQLLRDKSFVVSRHEGRPIEIKTSASSVSHRRSAALPGSPRSEELIEALMPATVPTAPHVLQLRRNAKARLELLEEFGAITSAEVADLVGSESRNRAALANRWRSEGRVFAVRRGEQLLYPTFQFSAEGHPKRVIADVLRALREDANITDWQIALWFTSNVGGLGGERPVEVMDHESERVIQAAQREATELVT